MIQPSVASARSCAFGVVLCVTILLTGAAAFATPASYAGAEEAAPAAAARPPGVRNGAVPTLERRLQALTRELGLDSAQQLKVRQILEAQRDAVRRIWVDPAVPPVERAAATQAQTERTGDEIRAVLNEDQKNLYNRSSKGNPPPGDKRSVEQWMDASQARKAGTP